ncbi:hypothetical protein K4F52_009077 [Lecanicillium sp. MT-2017a]|nr:hypothetical protein K4F52_009077 [Lecanicillium sp. MT-2017a]
MKLSTVLLALVGVAVAGRPKDLGLCKRVKTQKEFKEAIAVKGKVAVHFHVDNPTLRYLDNTFCNASTSTPDIPFVIMDVYGPLGQGTWEQYNVPDVPCFLAFEDGKQVGNGTYVFTVERVQEAVKKFVDN